MKGLENKIPPPALMLIIAAAMWGASKFQSVVSLEPRLHFALTVALGVIALSFGAGGIVAFRLARTNINPVHIDQASRVVTGGIYRVITASPIFVLFFCIWRAS